MFVGVAKSVPLIPMLISSAKLQIIALTNFEGTTLPTRSSPLFSDSLAKLYVNFMFILITTHKADFTTPIFKEEEEEATTSKS